MNESLLHSTLSLVSRFPNPVPPETFVPHWAIFDVTVCPKVLLLLKRHYIDNILQKENNWNATESNATGGEHRLPYVPFPLLVTVSPTFNIDTPEYGPGTVFGQGGPSAPSAPSTHSHSGAIAGGVIGGIAMISVPVAAIFYLRRRRSQAASTGRSVTCDKGI